MEDIVNSAAVARHLGVSRSAVSNWLKRGVLPENLRPVTGPDIDPVWPARLLPELTLWYASRRGRRGRPANAQRARKPDLELLLEYVKAAKKAAAVRGHQGIEPDDHYWMGVAWAYQDIERLVGKKLGGQLPPGR